MRREAKFNSINIVPFVDIMLVLLVIVLLTASFVQTSAIKTKIPKGNSTTDIKNRNLKITIKADDTILFNNREINKENIAQELQKYNKKSLVYIYANRDLKLNNFTKFLDILKENGYSNIGIVTKK